ncbi:MAG: replicative DNA helicase [Inhella sp.]
MSTPGQALLHTVQLPAAMEAEQSVLGALLIDNSAWDRAADLLQACDFGEPRHRLAWVALEQLITAGRAADPITVHDRLVQAGKGEEAGGLGYLNALAQAVPSSSSMRRYAEIVQETSMRRQLVREAAVLLDATLERSDEQLTPLQVAERQAERLLLLAQRGARSTEPQPVSSVLARFTDHLNAACEGRAATVPTGLHAIDQATAGGGRAGELWVVGARPSMGKSAFSQTLWVHVGEQTMALFLSQEDSELMLVGRAVANRGRVSLADLRNPANARNADAMWGGVTEGLDDLGRRHLLLDDQGGLGLADVRRKVQQAKRSAARAGVPLGLVIVDYLQLMTGDGDNRNQMLGAVANGLKALAKEQGVWMVLLSQLSRKADERSGVPQISDLRDSGDIEGAADVILLLHRECQRRQDLGAEWAHFAQVHVAKQKNGPTCTVPLHFDGVYQRFTDWSGPQPQRGVARRGSSEGLE